MSVLMVQSKVRADVVAEVDAAVERLFAAIDSAQLDGVRYASLKASDGVTYVALLEVEEGVDNPLPALPEFQEFQESLKGLGRRTAAARPADRGRVVPALLSRAPQRASATLVAGALAF